MISVRGLKLSHSGLSIQKGGDLPGSNHFLWRGRIPPTCDDWGGVRANRNRKERKGALSVKLQRPP